MNELVNAIKKENGPLNNDTSKSESIFTHDTTTRFSSNPAVLNIKTELFLQGGRKRPSSSGSLRANKSKTFTYVLLSGDTCNVHKCHTPFIMYDVLYFRTNRL